MSTVQIATKTFGFFARFVYSVSKQNYFGTVTHKTAGELK